ncbi:lipoate--protein ligase [Pokkaliibacter sp. CJK22405]|uniref:lipoate--protein ligase n=1 Tax=Pokkaliibacter sp. CJK22405 TaxID=3384615 RepID=UPI0039850258
MSLTTRLLISDSTDPWFNLAVEESIFRLMEPQQRVLFLWSNADTVVIGKAQNAWKECNTRQMEADNIKLARRQSGGGAVFHDLGNTNFTFMAGKPEYDRHTSTGIVLKALHSLGLESYASGRNDLLLDLADGPRKISGSAYRETPDRGFHHGTLLVNASLDRLTNYLTPDPKKLKAKGISSVRARVGNLTDKKPALTHDMICEALTEAFFAYCNSRVEPEMISPDHPLALEGFAERFAQQSSWEWNFGQALEFDHELSERFNWGGVELYLNVNKGHITEVKLFTDTLQPDPWLLWAESLKGEKYQPQALITKLHALELNHPEMGPMTEDVSAWLKVALA